MKKMSKIGYYKDIVNQISIAKTAEDFEIQRYNLKYGFEHEIISWDDYETLYALNDRMEMAIKGARK